MPIHYYVKTDLNAVKKIVDSMDGVEFDVPTDMVYDDPHQNLHIDLKKVTQLLDGEKACHLLQYRRGYTEGDITRIQMQQQFLKELIRQRFSKEGVENAAEIIRSVSGNIQTNYPQNNLKAVGIILSAIKENNISFETIPGKLVLYNEMPMYEIEQGDAEKNIINSLSSGL